LSLKDRVDDQAVTNNSHSHPEDLDVEDEDDEKK